MHQVDKPWWNDKRNKGGANNCYRCGGNHNAQKCWLKEEECRFCHKKGHIAKVCQKKKMSQGRKPGTKEMTVQEMEARRESSDSDYDEKDVYCFKGKSTQGRKGMKQWRAEKPVFVEVAIEGQAVKMELDTGAAVSILPFQMYREKFSHVPLQKSHTKLKTYTGEKVLPRGEITVKVEKDGATGELSLLVCDGSGPPLLGRNWLSQIPLEWGCIKVIDTSDKQKNGRDMRLKRILAKYPKLQQEKIGMVKDKKAH